MTEEQKKSYLENPNTCPYCESTELAGGIVQVDSNGAFQDITCNSCNKYWTDLYKLMDVEIYE